MKVVEWFESINGEGPRAGELALFVRFQGCNLRCSYCDTMWANADDCAYSDRSPAEIAAFVAASSITNVTLTGGEPLLQPEMPQLLTLLAAQENRRVEVETNGAVDLTPFCDSARPVFTMDVKLPSSGCTAAMHLHNLALLTSEDTVKFVCGDRTDLDAAAVIIRDYALTKRCHVYLSPVFGAIDPVDIVDYMRAHRLNDVRLQLQLHKFIWSPDKRGV